MPNRAILSYNYDSIARRRVLGGLELEIYGWFS